MAGHHHHHHHHHQGNGQMLLTTTESNQDTSTVMGQHSGHDGHDGHDGHGEHHFSTFQLWTVSKLLVQSWPLDSLQGLVAAMLFSSILAVVYEGSRFYYQIVKTLHHRKHPDRWQGTLVAHYVSRMWKALAYMLHFVIGYMLMLCTMTFNAWLLISVCLGSGIGYFFLIPLIQHVLHVNIVVSSCDLEHTVPLNTCRVQLEKSGNSCDLADGERGHQQQCNGDSDVSLSVVEDCSKDTERETML